MHLWCLSCLSVSKCSYTLELGIRYTYNSACGHMWGHTEAFSEIPKGIQAERLGREKGELEEGRTGRKTGERRDSGENETRVQGKIRKGQRVELPGSAI